MVLAVNLIKTNMIMPLMVRALLSLKELQLLMDSMKTRQSFNSKLISEATWPAELSKLNTDFKHTLTNTTQTITTMATMNNKSKPNRSSVRFSNNSVTSTTSLSQWALTSLTSSGRKKCN